MLGLVLLLCAAAISIAALAYVVPRRHGSRIPIGFARVGLLALLLLAFGVFIFVGPGTVCACPPALQQLNAGCQVQQLVAPQAIIQPQAFYAAPILQQQIVAQHYVQPQQIVVQQVRQQHAQQLRVQQIRVQQIRQPRVQVQSTRTVIRNR